MSTETKKALLKHRQIVSIDSDQFDEHKTAPIIGVTVRCLQNWRALRKGPRYLKVGRLVRYPRAEIEAFLARQLIETEGSSD
jgi:hypothetical protein